MDNFNSMTPGSAVADTIQQILQRRRDQQRQGVLDQLQGAQIKDQFQTSDMNRSHMADEMKTSEMNRKSLQEQILENQLQTLQEGADPSKMSPELRDTARSRGYMHTSTPSVSTGTTFQGAEDAGPQMDPTAQAGAPTEVFMTPAQRERERVQSQYSNYLAQNPQLTKENSSLADALGMRAQGLETPIPNSLMEPAPSAQVIPWNAHGRFTGPRGTQFMEGNVPPSAYQPYLSNLQAIDPDTGEGIFVQNKGFDPKNPASAVIRIPGFANVKKFGGTGKVQDAVPAQAWNTLNKGFARMNKETTTQWAQRKQQYRSAFGGMINANVAGPRVVDIVNHATEEMNRSENAGHPMPSPQIIMQSAMKQYPDLSPEEQALANQILSGLINPGMYAEQ